MIADLNATFQLNQAPYSRYRSDGSQLVALDSEAAGTIVQPGVITGDLQAAAHAVGWEYPPDPASLKDCSIGGNIATNAGGPRCLKYGVTRDYVLGLEVVVEVPTYKGNNVESNYTFTIFMAQG
jgi:hypothetical protein